MFCLESGVQCLDCTFCTTLYTLYYTVLHSTYCTTLYTLYYTVLHSTDCTTLYTLYYTVLHSTYCTTLYTLYYTVLHSTDCTTLYTMTKRDSHNNFNLQFHPVLMAVKRARDMQTVCQSVSSTADVAISGWLQGRVALIIVIKCIRREVNL
jgi:hypothetical protein